MLAGLASMEGSQAAVALAPVVVGISGPTRAGKSTVASRLEAKFHERGWVVATVGQDAFMAWDAIGCSVQSGQQPVDTADYFPDDIRGFIREVRKRGGTVDRPQCVDHKAFGAALASAIADQRGSGSRRLVVAEGFQCFEDTRVTALLDLRLWLDVPRELARERRMASKPVDPPAHFDEEIWPAHEAYRARVLAEGSVVVLDGTEPLEAVEAAAVRAVDSHLASEPEPSEL